MFNAFVERPQDLNYKLDEIISFYEINKNISQKTFFLNNVLFYDLRNQKQLFLIFELICKISLEFKNKKYLTDIFSKILYTQSGKLNKDDLQKLKFLIEKTLFSGEMFLRIIKNFEECQK
jgi:hypothetical protein